MRLGPFVPWGDTLPLGLASNVAVGCWRKPSWCLCRHHAAAITLLSNVDLNLDDDATLKFSTDPDMYPLVYTRWGGSNVTTAHRSYTHSVRKTLD